MSDTSQFEIGEALTWQSRLIGAASAGLIIQGRGVPGTEGYKPADPNVSTPGDTEFSDWAREKLGLPKTLPWERPHSYQGSPFGDGDPKLDALYQGFQHWWSGSSSFRPFVQFADDFYAKLVDAMRTTFGLGGAPTGAPSSTSGTPSSSSTSGTPSSSSTTGTSRSHTGSGGGGRGGGGGPALEVPQGALDAISQAEGTWKGGKPNYDDQLGHVGGVLGTPPKPISTMTLDEVDAWQTQMLRNPRNRWNSSAIGAFQIVRTTLRDFRKRLGLKGSDIFGAAIQGRLAGAIFGVQGSNAWEGFKAHPGLRQKAEEFARKGQWVKPEGGAEAPAGASGVKEQIGRMINAVIGDSIGVGLAGALGVPKDAIGGTTPEQIFARVSQHAGDYAGKTVALASGSNPNAGFDPKQMGYVRKTMAALHKAGANVVLMGVGTGVKDYLKINKELGAIAHEYGDPFAGVLAGTGGGRVHPRNYLGAAEQARQALAIERTTKPVAIDSDHRVEINIHGSGDPHGTARAVADLQDRHSMLHARNLRTAVA